MNPILYIEPFVCHSKSFRDSVSPHDRIVTRDRWIDDVIAIASKLHDDRTEIYKRVECCEFCGHKCSDEKERGVRGQEGEYFCSKCFFPLFYCETRCATEWTVFALLSVYYWESSERRDGGEVDYNLRVVWKERIKMAWMCERQQSRKEDMCCGNYIVKKYKACVQCKHIDDHNYGEGMVFFDFDYKMFCEKCLFPRFECDLCHGNNLIGLNS
uniref:Uncharacterized protein n=1 Tax=Spodoptera littoralis nuclear polyhedrosis virus TaxID=10456 RepID=A0A3G4S8V6_NPVSL|nr:hypothetical protein [Spodoptera littoralis nucleopolyhedrovirus]